MNHPQMTYSEDALEIRPVSLPGWEITYVIHHSSHAVLYHVVNKQGESAVVKLFSYDTTRLSDEQIHDFIDGVNRVRAIGFGGLVDIFNTGLLENRFYLLMEYLPGDNLAKILLHTGEVCLEQRLDWFEDIAISIGTLHNVGLIHRDLKPSNIMFREKGELILVDCGIESQWLVDAGFLDEGEVYCTPSYVSPETAAGDPCNLQSEIYSLGVIFYELLTNRKPYNSNSLVNLIKMHAISPIPKLPVALKLYQPALNKMMAKHPDDRYSTIDALLDDVYFA